MLHRAAIRTTTTLVSRRAFHVSKVRMGGHYRDGPLNNLPFNPRSKWFPIGYWTFMATGFCLPFVIVAAQSYNYDD